MSLSAAGMKTQLHYGIGSRKRFGRGPGRYYRAPKCQPARIIRADRQRPAAGVLREQGVGGPLPQPGVPPLGLDVNSAISTVALSVHRTNAKPAVCRSLKIK